MISVEAHKELPITLLDEVDELVTATEALPRWRSYRAPISVTSVAT